MKIERFKASDDVINEIAILYAQVFAEPPWNEVSRCSIHGYSSEPVGSLCDSPVDAITAPCGEQRTDAYPQDETRVHIREEVALTGAIAQVAVVNEIVAFSWGYRQDLIDLATSKWEESSMQQSVIETVQAAVNPKGEVFYLSEVGVRGDMRGQKIATQLVQETQDSCPSNIPWVVRTMETSPMARILDNFGFEKIIGPDLPVEDTERPGRVLYVTPACI